ncbi:hypothetical protein ES708_18340 [subsurface metagenome]
MEWCYGKSKYFANQQEVAISDVIKQCRDQKSYRVHFRFRKEEQQKSKNRMEWWLYIKP